MDKIRSKRVLVAGLFHETNTFIAEITGRDAFQERVGSELLAMDGDSSPLGGVLEVARERGWQVVPAIDMRATPSGTAADAVVERFWEEFRNAVVAADETPFDGVFLVLHGAMVSESLRDVEGEILGRIRALASCTDIPICGVLDLHANVSDGMARGADALLAYRENPHTDAREAACRTARLLDDLMTTGDRLLTVRRQPPLVWPPTGTATAAEPMRTLEEMARAAESEPGIVAVNVFAGFSFADVPEAGPSFTAVVRQGDREARQQAESVLQRLCDEAMRRRDEANIVGVALDAVMGKLQDKARPVLLVEPSDNIGAGAPGDGTHVLNALVERGIHGAGVIINDPDAVAALADALPGEEHLVSVGGRSGGVGAMPVSLRVTFLRRSDGTFRLEDCHSHAASMNGDVIQMGPCAVVTHEGVTLLLTSRKTPPFDLGQWRSQGVDPERLSVINVKAAVAHRRAYDPIAGASYTVETPGPCASDLRTLPFRHIRRPVFPLDVSGAANEGAATS